MKPPTNNPELYKFYQHSIDMSTEILEIERDALHAMITDIGPKLWLIREILDERKALEQGGEV